MATAEKEACCTHCAPKHAHTHEASHHDHEHGHIPEGFFTTPHFIAFVIGSLFFATALFLNDEHPLTLWVYIVAYLLIGGEILLMALKNIVKGHVFDENFLMSLATVGAFSIGEYPEGVAVMFFYRIGEFFQDLAVARSRTSIESLMDIRPDFATVLDTDVERRMSPSEVEIGAFIIVDTSALTGESLPKEVDVGDNVLSGCINKTGVLTIKTTKSFAESTVSKILDLVQNASCGDFSSALSLLASFAV